MTLIAYSCNLSVEVARQQPFWEIGISSMVFRHLTPLTLLEISVSYSMNTSLFLTRSHLSPNLAITIFVSFAVPVYTSIPKQLPPSPLPLFTPSLTTAILFITTCASRRSPGSNRSRTLLSSHITFILLSLHWLKITERIYLFITSEGST